MKKIRMLCRAGACSEQEINKKSAETRLHPEDLTGVLRGHRQSGAAQL